MLALQLEDPINHFGSQRIRMKMRSAGTIF
jgi:hypothetical protein